MGAKKVKKVKGKVRTRFVPFKTKTMKQFTFWKENKTDQEYTLTLDEIKAKYKVYLETKEQSWIEYYGHQTVNSFIGDKDGLNSVADTDTITALRDELMETRHSLAS